MYAVQKVCATLTTHLCIDLPVSLKAEPIWISDSSTLYLYQCKGWLKCKLPGKIVTFPTNVPLYLMYFFM